MWLIQILHHTNRAVYSRRSRRHVLTVVWIYIGVSGAPTQVSHLFILNFHHLMAYFDEVGGGLAVQFIIIINLQSANLYDLGFIPSSGGHKADCI
jgi:hypothetical protein